MQYGFKMGDNHGLIPTDPINLTMKKQRKIMRTSIALPSQYQAYAICVEFAKKWFMEKFKDHYFNSVYVDGTHSFDEFRKFSDLNQQLKRTNPLLAIIPIIDINHNRQWIDSQPEMPLLLKRSHIEGSFFNDMKKGLHIQLIFKSIIMNFTYKIRLNTRAEQLDMVEYIKLNHRAGWTESRDIALDIHIPKSIILQLAFDNGFKITTDGEIEEPIKLLNYLNSHSYIPFLYKLRCSTGNKEFFIKVPNCVAHIKAELPTMDDGERQDTLTTNYTVDFQIEIEMTAPYCYTYFSQDVQPYMHKDPIYDNYDKIAIMAAQKLEIPDYDKNGWDLFVTTEYDIDESDINKPIDIDFKDLFKGNDIEKIIAYTKSIAISPAIFMNFIIFNGDSIISYDMDWDNLICHIHNNIEFCRSTIAIYCDNNYINETLIFLNDMKNKSDRVE